MYNLLVNALKFTLKGEIKIKLDEVFEDCYEISV